MAILSTTVWDYQAEATAGNLNGGGFNPSNAAVGTDRSQTTAAYKTHGDLVIGIAGSENKVTSAAHAFTSDDNGNIINISAGVGFTQGRYEVVSVDGSNVATLDRNAGTAESTGGTYYLGGALSLPTDAILETFVPGNTIWIKLGTYVTGAAISIGTAHGTSALPITVRGYQTTHTGDPTLANRPTINMEANGLTFGNYWIIKNLIITGTTTNMTSTGTHNIVKNCKLTNTGTATKVALNVSTAGFICDNEISSTNGNALSLTSAAGINVRNNYIRDSVAGILTSTGAAVISGNIITNCTAGISITAAAVLHIFSNSFYGNSTAAGTAVIENGGAYISFINNIVQKWLTPISWSGVINRNFADYNNYFENTNALDKFPAGANDTALDPAFVDPSNADSSLRDFRVGANMKATGWPGTWVGMGQKSTSVGYTDMGALQRIEPTSTGGGAWVE